MKIEMVSLVDLPSQCVALHERADGVVVQCNWPQGRTYWPARCNSGRQRRSDRHVAVLNGYEEQEEWRCAA